jgi:galactokinase
VIDVAELRDQFREAFGAEPRVFSAPGRVNLIGEHTDYNDGFVLPMALDRRTCVAIAPRTDREVVCRSAGYARDVTFTIDADLKPQADWANHVRGVAAILARDGVELTGGDMLIASDVPIGAGLSSSAALEIAVGYALLLLVRQPFELVALARAAQRAEHEFAGTRCGLMDQLAACFGRAGHALAIDCRSLEYRAVPLQLGDATLLIANTLVKHDHATGEYNKRRAECEESVRLFQSMRPDVRALRDVTPDDLNAAADRLPPLVLRRCRHVVTENVRTRKAITALERGELHDVGRLMRASHASLRDDFEVSCPELDLLADVANACDGVYGSRMTGGGFGGCTVTLLRRDSAEQVVATLTREYERATGLTLEVYACQAGSGVREDG